MPRKRKRTKTVKAVASDEQLDFGPLKVDPLTQPLLARWRPLLPGEITRWGDFRQEGERWVPAQIGVAATADPLHMRSLGQGAKCWLVETETPFWMVGNGSRAYPFASVQIALHLLPPNAVGMLVSLPALNLITPFDPPEPHPSAVIEPPGPSVTAAQSEATSESPCDRDEVGALITG